MRGRGGENNLSMFAKDISIGIVGARRMFKLNSVLSGKCLNNLTGRMVTNKLGTVLVQIMGIKETFSFVCM